MVYKDYKIGLKFVFQYLESTSRSNASPVLLSIVISLSITVSFWSPSHASFLTVSSISFWLYTCWSMIYCFRVSCRHVIQTGISEPKVIFLYSVMVSLMASSRSSFVFIQFPRGIFNIFVSSNSDFLFIYYQFCSPS